MNRDIRDQWVAKLRSGDVEQGQGSLHYVDTDNVRRMCCLGVLSDLAYEAGVIERTQGASTYFYGDDQECALLPADVQVWAGLNGDNPVIDPSLPSSDGLAAVLNDGGKTFAEIADLIEQNL